MARQMGPIPLSGTFDNITLYKTEHGLLARKKSSLDAKRVAKDACFARTRQNAEEFRRAISGGQLLRRAVNKWYSTIADNQVTSRMNGVMLKVLRADTVHARGERRVSNGEPALTKGLEFNRHCSLRQAMPAAYQTHFNTTTGKMQIRVPSVMAGKKDWLPAGATHCKIISVGASVDFDNSFFSTHYAESEYLPLRKKKIADNIVLDHEIKALPGQSLFLWLGVVYYRVAGDNSYALLKGGALAMVEAGVINTLREAPAEEPTYVEAEVLAPALVADTKEVLQDAIYVNQLPVHAAKKLRINKLVVQRRLHTEAHLLENRKMIIEPSMVRNHEAVLIEDG
jgi:hypothetical protein